MFNLEHETYEEASNRGFVSASDIPDSERGRRILKYAFRTFAYRNLENDDDDDDVYLVKEFPDPPENRTEKESVGASEILGDGL
ncbi:hypothetical protein [Haloarcula amylolytica]|uniref:hypothetical protein n=1 Tax=Haloarcula amylolytica TaxID=396317 RepID=UPI003C717C91